MCLYPSSPMPPPRCLVSPSSRRGPVGAWGGGGGMLRGAWPAAGLAPLRVACCRLRLVSGKCFVSQAASWEGSCGAQWCHGIKAWLSSASDGWVSAGTEVRAEMSEPTRSKTSCASGRRGVKPGSPEPSASSAAWKSLAPSPGGEKVSTWVLQWQCLSAWRQAVKKYGSLSSRRVWWSFSP